MKFATVRDFRVNASRVMEEAEKEEIIITKRGRPFAMLVPVSGDDIDRVRRAIKGARLRSAFDDLWKEAKEKGANKLTMEEIDEEIQEYRNEKRSKGCH